MEAMGSETTGVEITGMETTGMSAIGKGTIGMEAMGGSAKTLFYDHPWVLPLWYCVRNMHAHNCQRTCN